MGKCPDCGTWDSLEEEKLDPAANKDPQRGFDAALALAGSMKPDGDDLGPGSPAARKLADIDAASTISTRLSSGIHELDRVFGTSITPTPARHTDATTAPPTSPSTSGLVPGSAVLIGGEPGIGKSTLLLQAASRWAASHRVLYVTSEESAEQIKLRATRLSEATRHSEAAPASRGANATPAATSSSPTPDNLFILADTNLARIIEQVRQVKPAIVIIDSVQMIYKADLPASPGSITQLRRCCSELVYLAKLTGIAIVLVGHVTKEGSLAGPRLLEHLVDAVIYFEGDRYHTHRVVRAIKNRFGTTLEIGLFQMTSRGLEEVPEGSGVVSIAGTDDAKPRPGSVICPVITGTRCVLIEVQALTATGFLGAAKRKCSGLDQSRLAMLIAVLEQHAQLRLADRDIFASSVGGLKVAEPAADLALLLAIAGAHFRRALAPATAAVGEVGLGGEVRPVTQLEQRLREAARLGYKRLIIPPMGKRDASARKNLDIELVQCRTIDQAIEQLG